MEIEVVHFKSNKSLTTLYDLRADSTISDVKKAYRDIKPDLYPERQSYRLDPKGKSLKDGETLKGLGLSKGSKIFYKDLGPQVGWTTVFLTEYAGPLFIYLFFYLRPSFIYGKEAASLAKHPVVDIAVLCWILHYGKRLLETTFVHRFSNATMPIRNIFKNSTYYWGFGAYIAYYVNHPLYTSPTNMKQIYGALAAFLICEIGNLSIHLAFRSLRPAGSKERRIPFPTGNPFTALFSFVSCPNYTYEIGAWLSFSVMTQCLPALMFTGAGLYQMTVWALGKHRNYKKEFKDYPRSRKSIIPFII